jgi:hypothetical protein
MKLPTGSFPQSLDSFGCKVVVGHRVAHDARGLGIEEVVKRSCLAPLALEVGRALFRGHPLQSALQFAALEVVVVHLPQDRPLPDTGLRLSALRRG